MTFMILTFILYLEKKMKIVNQLTVLLRKFIVKLKKYSFSVFASISDMNSSSICHHLKKLNSIHRSIFCVPSSARLNNIRSSLKFFMKAVLNSFVLGIMNQVWLQFHATKIVQGSKCCR